jgi:hypothetical protein
MDNITELGEARKFAKENGYILAMYTKNNDGNYDLTNEEDPEEISDSTVIKYNKVGTDKDFSEVETLDRKFIFILHNNYNIPKIIPRFH